MLFYGVFCYAGFYLWEIMPLISPWSSPTGRDFLQLWSKTSRNTRRRSLGLQRATLVSYSEGKPVCVPQLPGCEWDLALCANAPWQRRFHGQQTWLV